MTEASQCVDVSDTRETYKVLDLALRIGEILLSSGAGAADVTATMQALTRHHGLRNADIDVTFTLLRTSYQDDPDEMPVLLTRNVQTRDIDYDDLTRVHLLIGDVLHDRVSLSDARAQVARINSTGHYLPKWSIVLGHGLVGGGIAVVLGAGLVVTLVATIAGILVTVLTRTMNRQRWPMFYQQTAGGLLATLLALLTTHDRPPPGRLAGDHREHRDAAQRHRLHGRDPGRAERVLPDLRAPGSSRRCSPRPA